MSDNKAYYQTSTRCFLGSMRSETEYAHQKDDCHHTKLHLLHTLCSPSGRNTARATVGGEFPSRTLSIVRRVPKFHHSSLFRKPPSHPVRSDFPSTVGGSSYFP